MPTVVQKDPPQAPFPYAFNKSHRMSLFDGTHGTLFLCNETGEFGPKPKLSQPSQRGIAILILRSNNKKTVRLFVNNDEIKDTNFKLFDDYLVFYQAPYFGRVEITGDGNRAFGAFQDTDKTHRSISGYAAPLSCIKSISPGKVEYNFSAAKNPKPSKHPGSAHPAPLASSFHIMDAKGSKDQKLSVAEIMSMNPFKRDKHGNYYDVVQSQCTEIFYKLVVYYLWKNNSDMYKLVYGNSNKPSFYNDISTYVKNPLSSDQENFCNSLAVPYLCTVVGPSDEYRKKSDSAKQVNYNRASTYLKHTTSKSKTFQSMMQNLYIAQFISSNSRMEDYLKDQAHPPSSYATSVIQDAAAWSLSATTDYPTDSTISQDPLNNLVQIINNASALGQGKNYWAYQVFRYVSAASFLNDSFLEKLTGTTNSSQEIDLLIKHTVGLLNVLDTSQTFSQMWLEVIQGYSMLTMFMNLADYASLFDYISDPTAGLKALLTQMAANYVASSDPDMQALAVIINENLGSEPTSDINMFFEALVISFSNIQGLSGFDALETELRTQLPNVYSSHGLNSEQVETANKFMDAAIVGTSILSIAMLAAGGSQLWDEMAPTDKAAVVAGLAIGACVVLKYVIKIGGPLVWPLIPTRIATLFTIAKTLYQFEWGDINAAILRTATNVMNQLNGVRIARPDGVIVSEVTPGHGILTKIFGNNFNEFLTRVGGVVAILGIVVSAIGIANAETPTDIAINVAFLVASTAELIASAAGWAVSTIPGVLGAMGCAIIAGIATFAAVFAIGAALLGAAILLVMFFVNLFSSDDPIEDFVKKYVKPAGYYMQYKTDYDYLTPIPKTDGTYDYVGINIQMNKQKATSLYVDIDSNNNVTMKAAPENNSWHTTFSWAVDLNGNVLISAIVPLSSGQYVNKFLTAHSNGTVSFDDPIFRSTSTGPVSDNSTQLWTPVLQSVGKTDDKSKYQDDYRVLESCVASLQSNYFNNVDPEQPKYLVLASNQITLSQTAQPIEFLLTESAPEGYIQTDILMYVGYNSHMYIPAIAMKGTDTRKFALTGNNGAKLPSFLKFDTSTGIISQTKTIQASDVTPTPLSFTATVSNHYGSAAPCTFTITVSAVPQ